MSSLAIKQQEKLDIMSRGMKSTKVQTLGAYHSTTCIYYHGRPGRILRHYVSETCIYSPHCNRSALATHNYHRVPCGGPGPVDFLASYWPPASVAGLRGNAWFTSCPSSCCCASLISKVRENGSQCALSNLHIGFFTP